MFAQHIPLKSNHANAYRVLAQTSLYPADCFESREQLMRMVQTDASMIQTRPISSVNLDWRATQGWHLGQFILANSVESRQRRWRQKSGELTKLGQCLR